jgi:selenide,water dikinase
MDKSPIKMTDIKMTEYSHGSGCGCKISPAVLDVMLKSQIPALVDESLLVGNSTRDDAAVYDLGNGTAIISTTDFFMPIVDDPFTFGRIAATNAISDIYAMGGKPIMAIAIFGWPLDKLPAEVDQQGIEGGRQACQDAGILLAGGHSIDAPEPIFGLAVTGTVATDQVKQNSTAKVGNKLYLTKPLGVGILSTAQKKKIIRQEHANIAPDSMCKLNTIGTKLAALDCVTALTDVTGFGLGGHLREVCEGSGLQAKIDFDQLPILPTVMDFLEQAMVNEELDLQIEEAQINEGSSVKGASVMGSRLRQKYGVIIIAIKRKCGKMVFNPGPEEIFLVGDIIVVIGKKTELLRMNKEIS